MFYSHLNVFFSVVLFETGNVADQLLDEPHHTDAVVLADRLQNRQDAALEEHLSFDPAKLGLRLQNDFGSLLPLGQVRVELIGIQVVLPAGVLVEHPEQHLDRLLGVVRGGDETVSTEKLLDLVQIAGLEHHDGVVSQRPDELVLQRQVFVHLHQVLGLNDLVPIEIEYILLLLAHLVVFLIFLVKNFD